MESVLDVPRKLRLKFYQNWVSNRLDIPDMEMDICHMVTFVHISNILSVTDPILNKLFEPSSWGP